jgi:hypothetical protein
MRRYWVLLVALIPVCLIGAGNSATSNELIVNGNFTQKSGRVPTAYQVSGDAEYRYLGDPNRDMSGWGIALISNDDLNHDGSHSGLVSQTVSNLNPKNGRWFRFSFRGLPQNGFVVDDDDLYVKVEYFSAGGKTSYDHLAKKFYSQIEQARKDLAVNAKFKRNGAEAWRTYEVQIRVPFPEVGQAKFTVGFSHGRGTSRDSAFYVTDFSLTRIDEPTDAKSQAGNSTATSAQPAGKLIPLGGRWFYQAGEHETTAPKSFDYTNADKLWYHDAVWQTPFAGNMSAVLRAGMKDLNGNVAQSDTPLLRNVMISFDGSSMVMHTSGIPNHPTGKFPEDRGRGNPSYITMQDETFYLPLEPKENPKHFVTDETNSNHALNMGAIGVALNGVVFFNPFDLGNTDATDLMDRCCGHPQQQGQYHYHKYPICVNSPWDDQGSGHSGLLGFAFDGYPLYGPYESPGVMAKDVTGEHALNDFNLHYDEQRGWHYHVTPGKFPYLIGGYWGTADARDVRRGPPRGGNGRVPEGGRGPGGPPPPDGRP